MSALAAPPSTSPATGLALPFIFICVPVITFFTLVQFNFDVYFVVAASQFVHTNRLMKRPNEDISIGVLAPLHTSPAN